MYEHFRKWHAGLAKKKKSDEVKRSTLHLYLTTETKAIKQFLKQQ